MAAFPRAYRSSATHWNGGTASNRRATPSQTARRTYSDVGTGIHNAKAEGIKEGGELPRLCNFIAESAIRFLSKLSCRSRRGYRAAHQPKLKNGEQPPKKQQHRQSIPAHHRLNRQRPPHLPLHNTPYSRHKEKRKQPPLGTRHSTPWTGRNSSSRQHRVTHGWRNAKVSRDRCSWN